MCREYLFDVKSLRNAILILLTVFPLTAAPLFAEPSLPPAFGKGVDLFHGGDYKNAFLAFGKIHDPELQMETSYMKGLALLRLERADDAAAYFMTAARSPIIGDWAIWHLMESAGNSKKNAEVIGLSGRFLKEFAYSPLEERVLLLRARALDASKKRSEAISLIRKKLKENPSDAHEFLWLLAGVLEKTGKAAESYRAYQDIFYKHPHTKLSEPARLETVRMQKKYKKSFKPASIKEKIGRLKVLEKKRKYADIEKYISSMNLSGLSSDMRSRVLMYLARALNKLGKNAETLKVCRRVIKEPENPQTPHAIYLMAKTYWNWGESDKAMKALDKLFKRFSWHSISAKGYYMAGRIKESGKDYAGALNSWEKAVSRFPQAEEAQTCLWHIGWRYYQDGDYAKAEKAFNRFLKKYPASNILPRILYWNARAMEEMGKDPSELVKRLMTVYRHSYYAYLRTNEIFHKTESARGNPGSQKRLAEKVLARFEENANETVKGPKLEGRRLWAYRGAQRWLELGFKERARPLMEAAAEGLKNGASNTMWLMYQYYRAGFHDLVQSRAWRVQNDPKLTEKERRLLTWMMFPLARWSTVYNESRKNGVDPMAVLALIRQESKFSANIVSSADARGLMQIIPPTGKRISRAMKEKNFDPDFLFDPEVNIRMGTFYLAALLRKSGGELAPALAGYNAGSRAVNKWLKKYSYSAADAEVFIEKIPYPETRGYVKKVLRNYGAYLKTYGKDLSGSIAGGTGKKANAGRGN